MLSLPFVQAVGDKVVAIQLCFVWDIYYLVACLTLLWKMYVWIQKFITWGNWIKYDFKCSIFIVEVHAFF